MKEDDIFTWTGRFCPLQKPYNDVAFNFKVTFPKNYPFQPPEFSFTTPILHPNVDLEGQVCIPFLNSDKWKPSMRMTDVIKQITTVINNPDLSAPLNNDNAHLFNTDKEKWTNTVQKHSKRYGLKKK